MKYLYFLLLLYLSTASEVIAAVDKDSSAYQTGSMVGKIFAAILFVLIVRKIFFKKKE